MSQKMGKNKEASAPKRGDKANIRNPGLNQVKTTQLFRVVNPELFIKPNRIVMGIGLTVITGCVAYLAYINVTTENRHNVYMAVDEKGELQKRYKSSRWD